MSATMGTGLAHDLVSEAALDSLDPAQTPRHEYRARIGGGLDLRNSSPSHPFVSVLVIVCTVIGASTCHQARCRP